MNRARYAIISFEGPDTYSQAGRLGARVSGLAQSLAALGLETHVFFIGDPTLPAEEARESGRLVLHRWAQWLSRNCATVYDAEPAKVHDFTHSLPPYLLEHLILPTVGSGRRVGLLFEEWQTAATAVRLHEMLVAAGVRERVAIAWNANHCYGFDRIDWNQLVGAASITTVSRHMRDLMRAHGVDARVIPNGIPHEAFEPIPRRTVTAVRSMFAERPRSGVFFKMARWERDKGWTQALDAASRLRDTDRPLTLIARSGGSAGNAGDLRRDAEARGLRTVSFKSEGKLMSGLGEAIRAGASVIDLAFGVSPALARTLYAVSDGVLANSISEPFALVGLEAMAAGGVAYTGGTGDDYAVPGRNAVVLQTLDPAEIVARWTEMSAAPEKAARLRRRARKTAHGYEWQLVVGSLIDRLIEVVMRLERAHGSVAYRREAYR